MEKKRVAGLKRGCKIHFLPNCVFRQNNPAIIGIEVIAGVLQIDAPLMNEHGERIGVVRQIQQDKKVVERAHEKEEMAISLVGPTVGRQIHENDMLYSFLSEQEFLKLKDNHEHLTKNEIEALREIAEIMRKENPTWGRS
jgi:translation initiation factor 5B